MRAIALLGVIFFGNVQIVQAASIDFEIAQVSPVTDAQPLRRIFKVPLRDDGMSGPHHKARHFRKRAIAFRAGKPRYWGCVAFVANATGFSGLAGNGKGMADSLQREKGYRPVSCDNPPPGTVASWPGPRRPGHTAKWNGRCFQYDVGCTGAHPRGFGDPKCVAPTLISQK